MASPWKIKKCCFVRTYFHTSKIASKLRQSLLTVFGIRQEVPAGPGLGLGLDQNREHDAGPPLEEVGTAGMIDIPTVIRLQSIHGLMNLLPKGAKLKINHM